MRFVIAALYYMMFITVLGLGSLFLRSGETILNASIRSSHDSEDSNIFKVIKSEIAHVSEQVYVNTLNSRLNSIEGLSFVSKKKLREFTGFAEGMEMSLDALNQFTSKLSAYPWVKSYVVNRDFYPGRIQVVIEESKPAYIADYLGVSWVVSKEGVLLDPSSEIQEPELAVELLKLPRLLNLEPSEADSDTYLSSYTDRLNYIIRSYDNIDLAGGFPFQVSSLTLVPGGGIKVETFDGSPTHSYLVEVHTLAEARAMLSRLKAITADMAERGEEYKELDFRYEDQAIKR